MNNQDLTYKVATNFANQYGTLMVQLSQAQMQIQNLVKQNEDLRTQIKMLKHPHKGKALKPVEAKKIK